jgi:hypothetical protein
MRTHNANNAQQQSRRKPGACERDSRRCCRRCVCVPIRRHHRRHRCCQRRAIMLRFVFVCFRFLVFFFFFFFFCSRDYSSSFVVVGHRRSLKSRSSLQHNARLDRYMHLLNCDHDQHRHRSLPRSAFTGRLDGRRRCAARVARAVAPPAEQRPRCRRRRRFESKLIRFCFFVGVCDCFIFFLTIRFWCVSSIISFGDFRNSHYCIRWCVSAFVSYRIIVDQVGELRYAFVATCRALPFRWSLRHNAVAVRVVDDLSHFVSDNVCISRFLIFLNSFFFSTMRSNSTTGRAENTSIES